MVYDYLYNLGLQNRKLRDCIMYTSRWPKKNVQSLWTQFLWRRAGRSACNKWNSLIRQKKNEKRLRRLVRGQNQSQSNHNPIAQLSETSTTWCLMMMIRLIHHKINNAPLFTRSVSFSKNWAITISNSHYNESNHMHAIKQWRLLATTNTGDYWV